LESKHGHKLFICLSFQQTYIWQKCFSFSSLMLYLLSKSILDSFFVFVDQLFEFLLSNNIIFVCAVIGDRWWCLYCTLDALRLNWNLEI